MAILQKGNRGFLSPMDFDTFCNLAQMDLFENLFYRLNKWKNNDIRGFVNADEANIVKNLQEQINIFATSTTNANFTYDTPNNLWSYTGTDLYRSLNLTLKNAQGKGVDIEEATEGAELNKLLNSTTNAPSTTYPMYTKRGNGFRIYPTVPAGYTTELLFIRAPKQVKWPYLIIDGNPIFNASSPDLQDFEISDVLFPLLVSKILAYAGISIKDSEVAQIAAAEEATINQNQS